jgi:hypothetical protein
MNEYRLELADVFRTHEADFLAAWGDVLSQPQKKGVSVNAGARIL